MNRSLLKMAIALGMAAAIVVTARLLGFHVPLIVR
jgi:hypothetical protein